MVTDATYTDWTTGKQRKNRMKEFRGTAKTKGGAKKDKK
jgi:small subunit ribosomal protein S24e